MFGGGTPIHTESPSQSNRRGEHERYKHPPHHPPAIASPGAPRRIRPRGSTVADATAESRDSSDREDAPEDAAATGDAEEAAESPSADGTAQVDDDAASQLPLAAETAGTLEIAVNIARSADLDNRVGYLLVNPGGPGASGLDYAEGLALNGPPELGQAFDIVGFDPRGVGQSGPTFACGVGSEQFDLLNQIDELPDTDEELEIGRRAAELCTDSMGPVALQLGTDEVAQDMDEIRKALGAEQVSYLGASYGSTIGGWYASRFSDNVYSMVIDGAANPTLDPETDEEILESISIVFGGLHAQFAAAIDSCDDDACPMWNDGDPVGYWMQAAPKMDLVAEAAGGDKSAVLPSLNGFLYQQASWPVLHEAVFELVENDDPSLMLEVGYANSTLGADPTAANFTEHVNCLDSWALDPEQSIADLLQDAERLEDKAQAVVELEMPLFATLDIGDQLPVCSYFGLLDPPTMAVEFNGGDADILVVGNVSDQVTPFVQSEQLVNDVFTNGHLVKVDHFQHVVYPGNSCVNAAVHAALIDQQYPEGTLECEADEPVGLEGIELVETELPDGAKVVFPDGWLEVDTGVWVSPTQNPVEQSVLAYFPSAGSVEADVAEIEAMLGATATPFGPGEIELDGLTWSLFEITVPGVAVRFAVNASPNEVVILGQANPDDIDALTEAVLQPAVASFQTS